MCTQGSELLARWQKPLPPGVQCFQAVPFALDLDYVFPELLRGAQIPRPAAFSEVFSYFLSTGRFSCQSEFLPGVS